VAGIVGIRIALNNRISLFAFLQTVQFAVAKQHGGSFQRHLGDISTVPVENVVEIDIPPGPLLVGLNV
jgi:hypothetical protein